MPIPHQLRPRAALLSLCLLAFSRYAIAGVEVFTTAGMPVVNVPASAAVVELDAPARLDEQLSRDLPANPEAAERIMTQRMSGADWARTADRLASAYTGLVRAWQLGVEKVPAVVVDSRYVVYGESDVAVALEEIERARGDQP